MSKRKIATIIGTRPELIKLSRVIAELESNTNHVLIHTGQNYDYELNQVFFEDLQIREPDFFLEAAGEGFAETIANVITHVDRLLKEVEPDALLILGDTNSCLAALPAKRRRVPIFHMEAGNRCFDQRVPEEINRKIVDHLSDINLPYTEHARRYLIAEGIRPETVIKTGSPMREVLDYYGEKISASDVHEQLGIEQDKYILVSAHREENVDFEPRLRRLVDALNEVVETFGLPIVMSTHPRTRRRLSELGGDSALRKEVRCIKPLGFFDYVKLQSQGFCVLSDSGTLTEESSLLKFPGVMLREAHERPEGMDEGVVIMAGLSAASIVDSVRVVRRHHEGKGSDLRDVADYEPGNVSKKVVRVILSYIDYINRTVWFR